MSFSHDVRNELARVMPEKECCRKAELSALLASGAIVIGSGEDGCNLRVRVENAATARKIFKMLKESYSLQSTVRIGNRRRFGKTKIYEVSTHFSADNLSILQELHLIEDNNNSKSQPSPHFTRKTCCKRSYLRGIFLSRGFVNRPENDYHLEIVFNDEKLATHVQKLLARFNIEARIFGRKSSLVLYVKESEKIGDFLRVVGANRALLEFENVRIIKSMRNTINRQVNCETANLAKTIDASVRQIDLINRAMEKKGWKNLPPQLKELALIRVDYPDYTLKELGQLIDPPLSKPGVAYRMRRLEKMAEDIIGYS
ncbi:MAG: DNA-binding protein WhiA [Syntrophomonadaceae bacterium]|nr:DNA-binding protein WhiA [Syntrophomonadaceae bacterium]